AAAETRTFQLEIVAEHVEQRCFRVRVALSLSTAHMQPYSHCKLPHGGPRRARAISTRKGNKNSSLNGRSNSHQKVPARTSSFVFFGSILRLVMSAWRNPPMNLATDVEVLRQRIDQLHLEHRDLDDVISRLSQNPIQDQLQLQRLKKRKLYLKDQI